MALLPISAYATSLALDDDAVYLLTSHAAYRLAAGKPTEAIGLDLGVGAVLAGSAFVFWSKGAIWSAPKEGGVTRRIATLPHRPQYFVSAGDAIAWVDLSDEKLYTIQTLDAGEPRVLLSSVAEISALNMVGRAVYFVQKTTVGAWRIGVVRLMGGGPEYGSERKGRTPALLTGMDDLYYYDVDKLEIEKVSPDLHHEDAVRRKVVCSPVHASSEIYCGSVEGLFRVSKETRDPQVLTYGRPGFITNIRSNSDRVVWTVDVRPEKVAVDMLRAPSAGDGEGATP